MPSTTFNGQPLEYIVRLDKRRKAIQIKVLPSQIIEFVSPGNLSKSEIDRILSTKSRWITGKFSELAALANNPVNTSLSSGAQILYQGEPYVLKIIEDISEPSVYISAGKITISLKPGQPLITTLRAWLTNQALITLREKTKYWAAQIGVRPAKITLKDQKTRWGSCSSLGNINYNWRIIMAPPKVIDYLVVHELCHLLVPNHSATFWSKVEEFSPDYKDNRQWLAQNCKLLSRIF